jgi:hypothetical protein
MRARPLRPAPSYDLAAQVRRRDPPGRHDPEQFWRDKTELAASIAALADDAAGWVGHGRGQPLRGNREIRPHEKTGLLLVALLEN